MESGIHIKTRLRFADVILLSLLVAVTVLLPRFVFVGAAGDVLLVRTPDAALEFSLREDGRHTVTGPLGPAVLVVEGGRARLENAPCPLKICEGMGAIERAGEVILCLPNRISVRVAGKVEVDAVTR